MPALLPIMLKFKFATEVLGAVNARDIVVYWVDDKFWLYTAVAYVVPPLVIDNVKEVAFPNLTFTLNIDG